MNFVYIEQKVITCLLNLLIIYLIILFWMDSH